MAPFSETSYSVLTLLIVYKKGLTATEEEKVKMALTASRSGHIISITTI